MTVLPTGADFVLDGETAFGRARVTVTEVGASLQAFEVDGTDLVQRYPHGALPSLGAGMVMAPWPNRIRDGRWNYRGEPQQLAITEPKFNNAIHGLLSHAPYAVVERSGCAITLGATIYPQLGYPFVIATTVAYALTDEGLSVQHSLSNVGTNSAPVAIGTHCYFKIGGVDTATLRLASTARTMYENDARYLPARKRPLEAGEDLRAGREVGSIALDHCFTDQVAEDGRYRTRLTARDARYVEVWTDQNFGHVVLLTTDEFIDQTGSPTLAVAIEPQTAAGDAFNNHEGLVWLEPDETWTVEWGVVARL